MPRFSASGVDHFRLVLFVSTVAILFAVAPILSRFILYDQDQRSHQALTHYHAEIIDRSVLTSIPTNHSLNLARPDHEHLLIARAPVDYDDYVCKGQRALGMITNSPPATHVWTEQEMNITWNNRLIASRISEHLEAPLNTLRIPHRDRDVHTFFAEQNKPFTDRFGRHNHLTQRPSNGYYRNTFIPHALRGTIIAESNYSPESQVSPPGGEIPALNRWSDIVWILWRKSAGAQASKLRFIIRDGVANDITRGIIDKATRSKAGEFRSPWPGRTFDMRTDDGKALLGTPHGIGVAYLVADHSNVLGRKIPFARVFTADDIEDRRRQVSSDSSSQYNWPYYLIWELRDTAKG